MAEGDRVLVHQDVTTVDAQAGTVQWLDDGPGVQGMVEGGFWTILDRAPASSKRGVKGKPDGVGAAESEGSES